MKTLGSTSATALLALALAGCTTPPGPYQTSGTVLGGASGAVLGGVIGHNSGRHTAEGALIGGVVGALAGALVGRDIDDSTRTRVVQGRPLTTQDIVELSRAGVGDNLIIGQIEATRTVYQLSAAQIIALKDQGVSDAVVDYMIRTPLAFADPPPARVQPTYYYEVAPPYPYFYYYRHVPYRHYYYRPHPRHRR